jgi:ADP-heptose:LPS heptosyltransferase
MFKIKQIMSIGLMRKIDSIAGKPIICLLNNFTSTTVTTTPKKVICTKFLGIGSTVLSIPLIQALKEANIKVAFWTFEGPGELAQTTNLVDEIWVIKPTFLGFLPTLLRTWLQARRFKADAFIDLEPTANFTAILSRLSCTNTRIGFKTGKPVREQLFTHLIELNESLHMTQNFCNLGKPIGVRPLITSSLQLQSTKKNNKKTIEILVNINASDLSWQRKWPMDHWVALCNDLLQDPRVELFFTGSNQESQAVSAVIKKIKKTDRIINLAGKTTIASLLVILNNCDLVISVDSGIMHLASLTQTPLIALFGPESPFIYGPRSRTATSIWQGLKCSPCLKTSNEKITLCKNNVCMKKIAPEMVYQECLKNLPNTLNT